ncbi:hypothetical protein NDU88_001774 [Pleurodeles waltl]|uniref:Uncharacterized protein n=1 Tax=Pleurodeles waltl TaxID=8319 RepID=A0AAV7UXN6_PLEWA|nr:hypothetical protein NDU88_001774 [Pleurodeles waltl]
MLCCRVRSWGIAGKSGVSSVNQLTDMWCVPRQLFFGTRLRAGFAAALGWLLMAPKALRAPKASRVSRVKPGLVTSMERRDQKHLPYPKQTELASSKQDGRVACRWRNSKWAVKGGW